MNDKEFISPQAPDQPTPAVNSENTATLEPREIIPPPVDPDTGRPLYTKSSVESVRELCAYTGRIAFPLRSRGLYKEGFRVPREDGWQTREYSTQELVDWFARGGWLGVVPASLGLWCVDVDEGGMDAVEVLRATLGEPLTFCETRRGFHVFYRLAEGEIVANRNWKCGCGRGELRGNNGYVVVWDASVLLKATKAATGASPVSPVAISSTRREPGPAENRKSRETRPSAPPSAKLENAVRFLNRERLGDSVDYVDWLKVGQAIHWESGGSKAGLQLWDSWSREFVNYPAPPQPSTNEKWVSFSAVTRPVTAASIYRMARSVGWRDPTKKNRRDAAIKGGAFPSKNAAALRTVFRRMGIEARLNLRSACIEFRRGGGPWEALDDAAVAALREEIAEWYGYVSENRGETVPLRYGKDAWYDAVNAIVHEYRIDPFLDWVASLPSWDGEPRLESWMGRISSLRNREGGTPPELVRWASQHLFLGALWRAKRPGCKLDEMVVLVGPPGIGKSTALSFVFPESHRRDWFTDQFDFLERRQARTEILLGSVIVEASEMAGSTKAENAGIKSFLSGGGDKLRLAFRRDPQTLLRRCILVGTGDHDEVLPNDSNLRRFVVIRAGQSGTAAETVAGVRRYLGANRDQLWAEAAVRYEEGVTAHLPPELARLPQLSHDFDDFSSFDSRSSLISLSPIFVTPL